MENTFVAKTLFGLEEILSAEIIELGGKDPEILQRAVRFTADQRTLYKINFLSRYALYILKPYAEFEIETQQDFYDQVFKINWEKVFSVDATFSIDAYCIDSIFTHTQYVAQRVKDAVADRFRKVFNTRPSVDREDPDFALDVYMKSNKCIISLNSSGSSLHRRSYRLSGARAPINEVLAAGIIGLSGWKKEEVFFDPMCGSGTLLIEAAMKATNTPTGFFRKKYAFESWNDFDPMLWKEVKEEALSAISKPLYPILGADISERNLNIAKENIKAAGFEDIIQVKRADFFQAQAPETEAGHIVCNPPYGERLALDDIHAFYEEIGSTLKHKYSGWKASFISSEVSALKRVGLRPSARYSLYNGSLACMLYYFNLYEGSLKAKYQIEEDTDDQVE